MIQGNYADVESDDDDGDDCSVKGDQAAWGTPLFKIFMSQAGVTKKVQCNPGPATTRAHTHTFPCACPPPPNPRCTPRPPGPRPGSWARPRVRADAFFVPVRIGVTPRHGP